MTADATELDRRTGADRRIPADPAVAAGLLAALERGEVEVLFQPQFAVTDGRVSGAEALARWRHPRLGEIGGSELFALAERAGRVAEVTRHVAASALAAGAAWPAPLRLSLNITPADLASDHFAETMARLLEKSQFPAARLTLEITEQSLVAELDRSARQLQRLADLGIRIALDDFGAGFCHFGYLKALPLHALKLDRSMIEGVGEDARDLAVLRGIVGMALALGLDVIAEGVETECQRAVIASEGCTAWQGFLGAAPMQPAEFLRLVHGNR